MGHYSVIIYFSNIQISFFLSAWMVHEPKGSLKYSSHYRIRTRPIFSYNIDLEVYIFLRLFEEQTFVFKMLDSNYKINKCFINILVSLYFKVSLLQRNYVSTE